MLAEDRIAAAHRPGCGGSATSIPVANAFHPRTTSAKNSHSAFASAPWRWGQQRSLITFAAVAPFRGIATRGDARRDFCKRGIFEKPFERFARRGSVEEPFEVANVTINGQIVFAKGKLVAVAILFDAPQRRRGQRQHGR